MKKLLLLFMAIAILVNPMSNVQAITPETALDAVSLGADAAFCFQGSKSDCAFMVWDVVAIALPLVPGSYVVKLAGNIVNYSDKSIEIAKGTKLTIEAAQSVSDINDAKKVVLGPYKSIKNYFSKAGKVEAHHLLEHRGGKIAAALGLTEDTMISIPLEVGFHDVITNRWANALTKSGEYGDSITDIFKYACATLEVYSDMPQLKNAALFQVIGSPKFLAYVQSISNVSKTHLVWDLYNKYGLNIKSTTQNNAFANPYYTPFEVHYNTFGYGFVTLQQKAETYAMAKFNADDFMNDMYNMLDVPYPKRTGFVLPSESNSDSITDVTNQFASKTVYIKSVETGQYLCGENNATVHANGNCGTTNKGTYKTTLTSDGWLGFQLQNGKWLSVQKSDYLRTEGEKLSSWECFKVYKKGNNLYLLSQKNNKFIQVSVTESEKPLKAARPFPDGLEGATWERISIEILGAPFMLSPAGYSYPAPTSQPVQPSQGTNYVENKYYYKTDYISGTYSGYWENGEPNGQGTLIYAATSNMYKSGARRHTGSFVNGARYGWGTTYYTDCYYEGQFYGMYEKAGKLVFDGKIYYTDGQYKGSVLVTKLIATSSTVAEYSNDTHWVDAATPSPSTPQLTTSKTKVTISNFNVTQYPLPSNPNITGIKITWESKIEGVDNIIFAPYIETLDSDGKCISASLFNDGKLSGFEYDLVQIGTTYRVSLYAFIKGTHSNLFDAIAVSNTINVTVTSQNNHTKENNQQNNLTSVVKKSAVFTKAYLGRETTPAYTDEEVIFIEYLMTGGWYSGEIWLNFKDIATNERVNRIGPVPSWNKTSMLTKDDFISGHTYQLYFTDFNDKSLSDSTIDFVFNPGSSTIYYPKDASQNLPIYDTSSYNNFGDGGKRYSHYGYYERPNNEAVNPSVTPQYIDLYIGFPEMDTPKGRIAIDNFGTKPIIKDGHTLLPIRAIIEAMGGTVDWDQDSRSIKCSFNGHNIQLLIDSNSYYVDYFADKNADDCRRTFDVPPLIYNNRTLIPARAVFEALGCKVDWGKDDGGNWDMVTITYWK